MTFSEWAREIECHLARRHVNLTVRKLLGLSRRLRTSFMQSFSEGASAGAIGERIYLHLLKFNPIEEGDEDDVIL